MGKAESFSERQRVQERKLQRESRTERLERKRDGEGQNGKVRSPVL